MSENRSNENIQLFDLVNLKDFGKVFDEVKDIITIICPVFDYEPLESIYNDILKLFSGEYPGYRKCNTEYHDLIHTINTLLTMARLIHGYTIGKGALSEKNILLGLISSLMHDTGYIQKMEDDSGTGAKYTLTHISRSIAFMERYFDEHDFSKEDFSFCRNCILCTNINTKMVEIDFSSQEEELFGQMLGIADILSQIADRIYLEKLFLLYFEFKEGNVKDFKSELDLLKKTIGFFSITDKRFCDEFGNLNKYIVNHFREKWNINGDLYKKTINSNSTYLKYIMDNYENEYHSYLRRDSILDTLIANGLLTKQK